MRLPEGWKRQPLYNIAEIQTGVAKGKQGLKDPIDVPYLRVANVQDGRIDLSEVKIIQIERTQLERFSLKSGDVLMTEGGDFDKLGRGDVWEGQISPCVHQNHVFAVRPDQSKITPYFLATLSASNYGKSYFLSCAKRSTNLASINSTQLKEFPVLIPPLPEQQKIAQILTTWDKVIEKLEALIAAKQTRKKALMQQLLTGKVRFVGFSENWQKTELSKICTIETGTSKSEFIDEIGTQFIIDMGSISREGKLIPSKKTSLNQDYLVIGQLVMPKDDIGGGNIIGRTTYIDENDKYILGDHVYKLTVIKNNDSSFLCYLINSNQVNKSLRRKANGTAQLGLGKKDVSNQIVFLPSKIEEQQKIAAVLSAADNEIQIHQNELAALKLQKKGLMQQLLTGKVRVKVEAVV